MISGRMGLWLAAQQAVLRQQLQPLAAKPGSGGGSPPHISALFQVTKAPGAPGNRAISAGRDTALPSWQPGEISRTPGSPPGSFRQRPPGW